MEENKEPIIEAVFEEMPGHNLRLVERPPMSQNFMPIMSVDEALARRNDIIKFVNNILTEGINDDYAVIPGSKKKTLLKAGAEKLANFFGLSPHFERTDEKMDLLGREYGEPFYYISYRCTLKRNGQVMGQAEGSSNLWEEKHRYRWVQERDLPAGLDKETLPRKGGVSTLTEFDFAIDRGDTTGQYGKPAEYWEKFRAARKNGTATPGERDTTRGKSKTWSIQEDTTLFRIPNPNMADIINTCQKLAQKRALVAAVLVATGASQFFTQDMEDMPDNTGITVAQAAPREDLTVVRKEKDNTKEVQSTEKERAKQPDIMQGDTTKDIKERNKAMVQRIMLDMDIKEENKTDLLTEYYLGFLGLDILPRSSPGLFEIPLKALDEFQTQHTAEAKREFISTPRKMGERLKAQWTQQNSPEPLRQNA